MNIKKMVMALFAGFFVMFLLAGLWHSIIMGDLYSNNAPTGAYAEPKMQFIALGYFILSLLMVYIYPKGYKGGKPVIEGLKFGIVIGLLWILPINLVFVGLMPVPGTEVMVKQRPGWEPRTNNWEFFQLDVALGKTFVVKRGFEEVVNRNGGNCFECHRKARPEWDFICERDHGCDPISLTREKIGEIQQGDPRCDR